MPGPQPRSARIGQSVLRFIITWLVSLVALILVTSLFGSIGTVELVLFALLSLGVAIALPRVRARFARARAAEPPPSG